MAAPAIRTFQASGTIKPSRVVVMDGEFTVAQCTATPGIPPAGVSVEAKRRAPGTAADDGNAAIVGEYFRVYGPGEECVVAAADGTTVGGNWVKSDANGRVVPASAGDYAVGEALESSSAVDDLIRILVRPQRV